MSLYQFQKREWMIIVHKATILNFKKQAIHKTFHDSIKQLVSFIFEDESSNQQGSPQGAEMFP